ncbi:MAG: TrmH family RNA methyltransferase [Terriglobales bacterium]
MSGETSPRLRSVSSRHNALVKELRRALTRGEPTPDGCCAIESLRLVEEAIRSGLRFRALFFAQSADGAARRLLPQIGARVDTLLLPDAVFASAVATESPQGVAALVHVPPRTLEDALRPPPPLLLVAAGIQDPGNLGTMIRSAEAFGASGVLLGEKTVSAFNPKAVRASAGSFFRLPVVSVRLAELCPELARRGLRLVAAASHRGTPLDQAGLKGSLALFVGNEGAGLPGDLLAYMDEVVEVPHSARVESLNAAVAASILLYEASRTR